MERIGPGARGRAVADVQTRLAALGFSVGPSGADGVFAEDTAHAVRLFQEQRGIDASGEVDGVTWRALVDANLSLGDRTLYLRRPYMHGDDVRQLQEMLGTLGFSCGGIDGVFGLGTEAAVREFQKSIGLVADGIVGRDTLRGIANLAPALSARGPAPGERARTPVSFGAGLSGARISVRSDADAATVEALARECAFRLASLLELAGAKVEVRWSSPEAEEGSQTLDVHLLGRGEADRLSVRLAGLLSARALETLAGTLGTRLETPFEWAGGQPSSEVRIAVRGLAKEDADTFCQRLAVAVFDAVAGAADEASGEPAR